MPQTERYAIEIHRDARRAMKRLTPQLIERLVAAIEALAPNPRPTGCKKLVGRPNHYRVRVGDWRISYAVYDDMLLILVVEIAPRGGAYRNL